jgi:hypothetical protein
MDSALYTGNAEPAISQQGASQGAARQTIVAGPAVQRPALPRQRQRTIDCGDENGHDREPLNGRNGSAANGADHH